MLQTRTHMLRKHTSLALALICTLLLPALCQAGGIITGKVDLPKPRGSTAAAKRYAGITVGEKPPFVAVVYVEGDFPKPATNAVVDLAQEKFQFAVSVLPIQTGTKVLFPNKDEDYHNVFSYSRTKRFDLGRYRKDEKAPEITFDEPGEVKLFCEIHEHMRASILVLDTPYFTTTDAEGNFKLENVPAGTHKVKIWLGRKEQEQTVTVVEGQTVTLKP